MEKVYVGKNNEAFVICPKCGFERNMDATRFRNTKTNVTVKCKCIWKKIGILSENIRLHNRPLRYDLFCHYPYTYGNFDLEVT